MRRPLATLLLPCMFCLFATLSIQAQESPALTLEALQSELDRLEAEIAAEEERYNSATTSWKAELSALETEQKSLSEKLLSAALDSRRLESKTAETSEELRALEVSVESTRRASKAIVANARDTAERLKIHARELPGYDAVTQGLDEVLDVLAPNASDLESFETSSTAIQILFGLIEQTHRLGSEVTLRTLDLRTAGGQVESVDLLSAGALSFAYRTSDGRIGFALASPSEAAGYRWSEDLDAETRDTIEAAIHAFKSDKVESGLDIPLDISGRVTAEIHSESSFTDVLKSGGPVMIPIALVALIAALLILERLWSLSRASRRSDSMSQRVIDACRVGDFEAAANLCLPNSGPVARTLSACLTARPRGSRAMEDAVEAQLLYELPRMERFLGGIAVLGSVAPLLGLLGTVTGIIETFGVIELFQTTDPSLLAGGISEALITTAAGLVVAIPIVLAHSVLHSRVDRVISSTEKHAANLLLVLVHEDDSRKEAS